MCVWNMRKKVNKAFKNWEKCTQDPEKQREKRKAYTDLKKEYFKNIKKAKAESWRNFTHECTDIYELNKIIQKKQMNHISLMKGCTTAEESLNVMMESHFPGSIELKEGDLTDTPRSSHREPQSVKLEVMNELKFLDPHEVMRAFNDMKALNAGGPDGLKAIVFQNLPINIITKISQIYKACISLAYTPKEWCLSNVIFLAKPNKDRYDEPGSFRPISMFNALIKGLEKLVKWELERNALSSKPLHKDQHAFSREKGTDTALVRVVDTIEKGLLRNQFTLGVFIDIAGAFNNLDTEKALKAMKNRGLPENLVSWFKSFVTNRTAHSDLLGAKTRRKLNLGTPQGGVLSPPVLEYSV